MRMFYGLAAMVLVLPLATGCDAVSGFLAPTRVTVELVNNGDYNVEAILYTSDEENTFFEDQLTELGDRREYTILPGETVRFSESCDDFQAIILDDADLILPIGSPETNTDLLRDGEDFDCGDTIIFTFSHPDPPLELNVTVTYERGD